MGSLIVSIVIFGVSVYLFWVMNKKMNNLKEDLVQKEVRAEMESLITEFNRTATRNIELIEDRVQELQNILQKADKKAIQLDERIERANRPIVVEKIVEKRPDPRSLTGGMESVSREKETPPRRLNEAPPEKVPRRKEIIPEEEPIEITPPEDRPRIKVVHHELGQEEKASPVSAVKEIEEETDTVPDEEQSRSDRLKVLLRQGKSREELLDMGFMENEINLIQFLIGRE